MSAAALSTQGLDKRFGSLVVASDINLVIPHGVRYALIGPNGAGKTTLINLITGMLRPDAGKIFLGDADITAVRPQHAGHQVDQRGLAGAVRSDQRIALAGREIELDIAGNDERTEALVQAARRQCRGAHAWLRPERTSRAAPPRMPFGRNITTAISSVPIQKYQYCGLMPENWSRATM